MVNCVLLITGNLNLDSLLLNLIPFDENERQQQHVFQHQPRKEKIEASRYVQISSRRRGNIRLSIHCTEIYYRSTVIQYYFF